MEAVFLGAAIVVVPLIIIGLVAERQEKKLRRKLGRE